MPTLLLATKQQERSCTAKQIYRSGRLIFNHTMRYMGLPVTHTTLSALRVDLLAVQGLP